MMRKAGALALVTALVVCLAPAAVEAMHRACVPRGTKLKTSKGDFCVCKPEYKPRGLQILQFYNNNQPSGRGFNPTCCKHCYCATDSDFLQGLHKGQRNKHTRIDPFDAEGDHAEVYKDLIFQHTVNDTSAQGIGDFAYFKRDMFPACQASLPDTPSTQDAVEVASAFIASCSAKWQWVKRFHDPQDRAAVVLSSWLKFKPGESAVPDQPCTNIKYLSRWYESVMTQGLNGVILHDCLPREIVDVLQNDRIKFEKVQLDPSSDIHFKQSPNDVRFVLFKEYLDRSDAVYDFVLMTDLHDVRFRRDPFSAMRARPDIEIFIGADRYAYKNNPFTWEVLEWCAEAYGQLPYEPWFGDAMTLNCGVVGGKYDAVLRLLTHVVKLYEERKFTKFRCYEPWQRHCDMAMFAIALMTGYETMHEDPWADLAGPLLRQPYRYDSGAPFTSLFTEGHDMHPNYVIHK